MPFILFFTNLFGISVFRLIAYAALAAAVTTGALAIRHHYVALGYNKALVAVAKQNEVTKAAADQVSAKADKCAKGVNGYWDVITQGCKLEETK